VLSPRQVGVVTLVMTLLGWVSSPLFIKHFSHSIDAFSSNGWRYGFSALIWLPVLVVATKRGRAPEGLFKAAIIPSCFNAVGQMVFASAHYLIDPGLLTFGLRLQLVFVTLMAAILFVPERRLIRTPRFLVGLACVFAGTTGTIILDRHFGEQATTLGVIMAIGSGLLFAGYALSVRYFMTGKSPILSFATISLYTSIILVIAMLLFGEEHGAKVPELPTSELGLLALSSIIGIALGHVFYYVSIQRLGIAVTAGVIQLQPVLVAAASATLFPDQRLLPSQWITGGLAILGAMIILWAQAIASKEG
jgi:drug/metabolite transporter (DMT)-like permease